MLNPMIIEWLRTRELDAEMRQELVLELPLPENLHSPQGEVVEDAEPRGYVVVDFL